MARVSSDLAGWRCVWYDSFMRVFTAQQMQRVDQAAVRSGLSLDDLMDAAGKAVANAALDVWPNTCKVLLLCGKGNNGGDGYVAARYLRDAGKAITVLELASPETDLKTTEARQARASFVDESDVFLLSLENVKAALGRTDLIIDALLGNGLSRPLGRSLAEIVGIVNASGLSVLSIDIPTGVSSDQADFIGDYIQASHTVQLAGPKVASVFYPSKSAFGSWRVADIGIPQHILEAQSELVLVDDAFVSRNLPCRPKTAHKYTAGTVLVIAGSERYLGAAELACRAAYRAGAGLVTLAAESRLPNSWPEIIFERLEWSKRPLENIQSISEKRAQVRVIGPGLDEQAAAYLPKLILQSRVPTVLDAGALTAGDAWFDAVNTHANCILTPHLGEAARLLGISTTDIQKDLLHYARALAEKTNAIVVLKSATTIIAASEGLFYLSTRGHEGMATGGTGDVLAGIIGAYLVGADNLLTRVCAAVYMHGLAGEYAAQRFGNGLMASDLIDSLALASKKLLADA